MEIAIILVAACLCAGLDRLRGIEVEVAGVSISIFTSFIYGLIPAYMLMSSFGLVYILAAAALFAIGSRFGWGQPIGNSLTKGKGTTDYEDWQFNRFLKENWDAALVLRGLMWGAPMLVLLYFTSSAFVPAVAMAIAMPLGPIISRQFFTFDTHWWGWQEVIRGFIFGILSGLALFYMGTFDMTEILQWL